jgi:glycerol uptake facilitator-like aquaporin
MTSYNYNLQKPKVYEVDKTIRSFQELRTINGQNYITITAAEGRKLMQRIPDAGPATIERVLAKGQEENQIATELPDDYILVESKDYARKRKRSLKGASSEFFLLLIETSKMQVQSLAFYQAVLAEFIGVFILTLVVCGLGLKLNENDSAVPSINGALGGGLTLATMIWSTNCISGGNLNPAISFVLMCTRDLDYFRGIFYIIFQLLGALAGAATLSALIPDSEFAQSQIAVTLVSKDVPWYKAFGVEIIITFLLALTVFACIDKKRKDLGGSYPLSIGLSVTCGALFGVIFLLYI